MEQVEDSVRVVGFKEPALRGSNVTLACPPGMILNGPDTLLCMGNGEWEPDPNKVECKNESTVKQGMLSQDGKIAVASSVTVCCDCNSVLHCWLSVWTPLSKEEESTVPPSIRIRISNFMEINEILQVKSAELQIFKYPVPPLFMHVHSV